MGLRCSLLGHDFADAELDRDREERGDEVVITHREVKTCRRCGAEQVLSENTEVRPVEPIDDVREGQDGVTDPDEQAEPATEDAGGAEPNLGGADGSDDAEFVDADAGAAGDEAGSEAADSGAGTGEWPDAEAGTGTATSDAAADAVTDDGVIIDGEERPAAGTAGEWPDAADTRVDERDVPAEAGPEVELGDEAEGEVEAEPESGADEGAEILDADAEGDDEAEANAGAEPAVEAESDADADAEGAGAESAASEWPDPAGEDRGFDAEPGGERTELEFGGLAPEGNGGVDAEATPSEEPTLDAGAGTAFVCPECGFSKPVTQASLRAGDICPECKKGYLREE
jgi:hypothetical protein